MKKIFLVRALWTGTAIDCDRPKAWDTRGEGSADRSIFLKNSAGSCLACGMSPNSESPDSSGIGSEVSKFFCLGDFPEVRN